MTHGGTPAASGTTARLIAHYHTLMMRPDVDEPAVCQTVFRSFARTLAAWLPADPATPILDVACGEGAFLRFLRARGYHRLAGCDLSPENVALCRLAGLDFVFQADALRLSEAPGLGRYGAIFALDLIEHLPKQSAVAFLEELRGRLLPDGYLVLQTPNLGSHLGWLHFHGDLSHEFGLTEHSARALLAAAGFEAQRIEVRPCWNATTALGRLREVYLRTVHRLLWAAEGAHRPRIPTRNLLIRAEVG